MSTAQIIERQTLFCQCLALMVIRAKDQGYRATFSMSAQRLEAVVTLYRDGKEVRDRADYDALGVWWEIQWNELKHGGRERGSEYRRFFMDPFVWEGSR